MLELGSAFRGYVDDEEEERVMWAYVDEDAWEAAKRVLGLCKMCCRSARAAVEAWIGVGRRLNVAKGHAGCDCNSAMGTEMGMDENDWRKC